MNGKVNTREIMNGRATPWELGRVHIIRQSLRFTDMCVICVTKGSRRQHSRRDLPIHTIDLGILGCMERNPLSAKKRHDDSDDRPSMARAIPLGLWR